MVHARPGFVLRGACALGLAIWSLALFVLTRLPGVEPETWASALFMASMFAALLAVQNAAEIRAGVDELASTSFLRTLRCRWDGVAPARKLGTFAGLTLWLVPTRAGSVMLSSLWRNHRRLLEVITQRAAARQPPVET